MSDLFSKDTIELGIPRQGKAEILDFMARRLEKAGVIKDFAAYRQAIDAREALSTTGIGFGIAIPHAKSAAVLSPRVGVGISKEGVDFGSDDGEYVHLIFMIAVPEESNDLHLRTLAALSTKLIDPVYRQHLLECCTADDVFNLLQAIELG